MGPLRHHDPLTHTDPNAAEAGPVLLHALADGGVVELVSDAGQPLISDRDKGWCGPRPRPALR